MIERGILENRAGKKFSHEEIIFSVDANLLSGRSERYSSSRTESSFTSASTNWASADLHLVWSKILVKMVRNLGSILSRAGEGSKTSQVVFAVDIHLA